MMGMKKQAGDGQSPSEMEQNCIANQGPKRTVELKKYENNFPN
jgi:hypothetical protein